VPVYFACPGTHWQRVDQLDQAIPKMDILPLERFGQALLVPSQEYDMGI
jgi:hypothetical protein